MPPKRTFRGFGHNPLRSIRWEPYSTQRPAASASLRASQDPAASPPLHTLAFSSVPIPARGETHQLISLQPAGRPVSRLFPAGQIPRPRPAQAPSRKRKRELSGEESAFHDPVPGEWPLHAGFERPLTAEEAYQLPDTLPRHRQLARQYLEAQSEERAEFHNSVCNVTWRTLGQPAVVAGSSAVEAARKLCGRAKPAVNFFVNDATAILKVVVTYAQGAAAAKRRRVETIRERGNQAARYLRRLHGGRGLDGLRAAPVARRTDSSSESEARRVPASEDSEELTARRTDQDQDQSHAIESTSSSQQLGSTIAVSSSSATLSPIHFQNQASSLVQRGDRQSTPRVTDTQEASTLTPLEALSPPSRQLVGELRNVHNQYWKALREVESGAIRKRLCLRGKIYQHKSDTSSCASRNPWSHRAKSDTWSCFEDFDYPIELPPHFSIPPKWDIDHPLYCGLLDSVIQNAESVNSPELLAPPARTRLNGSVARDTGDSTVLLEQTFLKSAGDKPTLSEGIGEHQDSSPDHEKLRSNLSSSKEAKMEAPLSSHDSIRELMVSRRLAKQKSRRNAKTTAPSSDAAISKRRRTDAATLPKDGSAASTPLTDAKKTVSLDPPEHPDTSNTAGFTGSIIETFRRSWTLIPGLSGTSESLPLNRSMAPIQPSPRHLPNHSLQRLGLDSPSPLHLGQDSQSKSIVRSQTRVPIRGRRSVPERHSPDRSTLDNNNNRRKSVAFPDNSMTNDQLSTSRSLTDKMVQLDTVNPRDSRHSLLESDDELLAEAPPSGVLSGERHPIEDTLTSTKPLSEKSKLSAESLPTPGKAALGASPPRPRRKSLEAGVEKQLDVRAGQARSAKDTGSQERSRSNKPRKPRKPPENLEPPKSSEPSSEDVLGIEPEIDSHIEKWIVENTGSEKLEGSVRSGSPDGYPAKEPMPEPDPIRQYTLVTNEQGAEDLTSVIEKGLHNLDVGSRRSARLQDRKARKEKARKDKIKDLEATKEDLQTARKQLASLSRPKLEVLPTLSLSWRQRLTRAMDEAPNPSATLATSMNNINLNRHAFGTCVPQEGDDPSGWLNDEIILSYLEHIVNYGRGLTLNNPRPKQSKDEIPRYAVFNTQWWNNLTTKGPSSVIRWANRVGLKGDRLLGADLVFIPINKGLHWTLLALYPRRKYAVHFNSLGNGGADREGPLRAYLKEHLKEKYEKNEWTFEIADSPQQANNSDCGVFTITTARMLALGWNPIQSYGSNHMVEQRDRILCELINGGLHGDFQPVDALAEALKVLDTAVAMKKKLEEELAAMED